jgi:PBSX family phage terminase large subunit
MPVVEVDIDDEVFLPRYRHLVHSESLFDIDFLYGGRDSGKSHFIAQMLVVSCLSLPYFRCVLARKVFNTIKESQWQLIKDICEQWGVSHLFKFNTHPLEIKCKNGNKFICRGFDEPGKLKSISNPSHCWVEEGNQIDSTDFVTLLTTLRYNEGNVKTWFSFNPECEMTYTEFWLYQEWFSHTTELSWEWTKTIDVDGELFQYKGRATHSTYKDNPYCKAQRKALYESYKSSKVNAYWYQTYTLGLWGYKRTGNPFWKCFDEALHSKPVRVEKGTIHIVADNNVNPYIAVSAWQVFTDKKLIRQIHEFPCESPNNTAAKASKQVVKWLDAIGYKDVVFVYGDPSANKRSTEDDEGRSFFDKFIATMGTGYKVVNRVQKSAPEVALSGAFVDEIYESELYGWRIEIGVHCRKSIEDYTMAKEDAEGKILKKRETDKETKVSFERYGHFSDDKRYFVTTILPQEWIKYKQRKEKLFGI